MHGASMSCSRMVKGFMIGALTISIQQCPGALQCHSYLRVLIVLTLIITTGGIWVWVDLGLRVSGDLGRLILGKSFGFGGITGFFQRPLVSMWTCH